MKSNIIKKYYPLIGILLIFLSFPSYDKPLLKLFPLFAWFSYVPFLLYARKSKSLKYAYPRLFALSVAANLLTYGWMGSFGNTVPNGDKVLLAFFIPTLSVIMASRILLCEFLSRRYPSYRMFIYPSVWLGIDFLQSYGYLSFPWIYLGYSQYSFLPVVQSASIVGIYGITYFLMLSNTVITDMIYTYSGGPFTRHLTKRNYKAFYAFIVVIILFGSVRLLVYSKREQGPETLSLSLIQSCISPWENWMQNRLHYLSDLIKITNEAVAQKRPDLVIWSESATLEPIVYDLNNNRLDEFGKYLISYVAVLDIPLLTAEIGKFETDTGFAYTNSAAIIKPDKTAKQQYSKIHLAPIGEWFPYQQWFPGLKRYLESMGSSSFTPGKKPYLFTQNNFSFATLICYEGMFPRLNTYYKRNGADFLVNITNDGWSDFYSGHMQHYAASVFRAVENGIWYVRVGNTGYTVILDPIGRTTESIPLLQPGYINGSVDKARNIDTVYQRTGDLFAIGIICILIILVLYKEISNRRNTDE